MRLKDDFSRGTSSHKKKSHDKNYEHQIGGSRAFDKLTDSVAKDVRKEMDRQQSIKETAKSAYLKGLTDESSAKEPGSKSHDSKFEMLPSEKSKEEKKQRHREEKELRAMAKNEAIRSIAHEEALKDKIVNQLG